jgi:hypothetical protein
MKRILPSDHRLYDINDLFGGQVTIDIGLEGYTSQKVPPKRTKRKKEKQTCCRGKGDRQPD